MGKKRKTKIVIWISREEATKTLRDQWGKEEDFEYTVPYCIEKLSDKCCPNECDFCNCCNACLKYVYCSYDEDDEHIYETRVKW